MLEFAARVARQRWTGMRWYIMSGARITGLSFHAAPLIDMREYADFLIGCKGGRFASKVIGNSGIATKGMAVNPLVVDPRGWASSKRMDCSLSEALSLGDSAIHLALDRADVQADQLGLFASVTTTTHSVPGLAALAPAAGMRPDVQILSIGPMGCYAAVPALSVVRNWVEMHQKPALLLAVDLFSPHLPPPPYDKELAVAITLFGDAASAVVVQPAGAGRKGIDIVDVEQLTIPAYAGHLQVHVGDAGMYMRLKPSMADVVASAVREPVEALLSRHRIDRGEVAWWAIHPGGRRIIDRVEEELTLPAPSAAAARTVMRKYGNTMAPAVLGVVEELQRTRPLGPGGHGVALAFGPGATVWALLLRGA